MLSADRQRSEVARLLERIRAEHEAAQLGLSGLASGVSKHEFITQKMENMSYYHQELQLLVGETPAIAMVAEMLEQPIDRADLSLP